MEKLENIIKQNQEFEMLLQNLGCGVCIYDVRDDKSLSVRYINEGYIRLLEGERNELINLFNENPLFGVELEERDRFRKFFREIIADRRDGEISFNGVTLTGRKLWVTLKIAYAIKEDAQDRVYATYFDNTNEKLMQHQLSVVIHNSPGAVCFFKWENNKLNPIVVSEKYSEMIGTDALKAIRETKEFMFTHVHPDDLSGVQRAVKEGIFETNLINYTYRSFNEKTKKYIWINVQGKAVPQDDGSKYIYVTYTDISIEKKIEEKLIENQRNIETAVESAGMWYWMYDWKKDVLSLGKRLQRDFRLPPKIENYSKVAMTHKVIVDKYIPDFIRMINNIS